MRCKKKKHRKNTVLGLPARIRTADLQSRSLTRYPAVPQVGIQLASHSGRGGTLYVTERGIQLQSHTLQHSYSIISVLFCQHKLKNIKVQITTEKQLTYSKNWVIIKLHQNKFGEKRRD